MSEQNSDPFDTKLDRIVEQVDAIAHFVGRTAELQMQTQMKLDETMELNRQTHAKFDRMTDKLDRITDKLDRIADTMQGYQEIAKEQARSTAELIKLVTVLASKAS
ncbi:MAG: hypothetical protein F6K30_31225 [Cyanothece sp. SIO2G6]|nr:hypothetical protein [Cyanothece sp. SIO2G6]